MQAMASSFLGFLDHTRRRITVSRTPLDEWSARCRDLYLTTRNTHNRKTSMFPVGFEPTISAGERPQTHALDRAATGTGKTYFITSQNQKVVVKYLQSYSLTVARVTLQNKPIFILHILHIKFTFGNYNLKRATDKTAMNIFTYETQCSRETNFCRQFLKIHQAYSGRGLQVQTLQPH